MLFVDDGSTDGGDEVLREASRSAIRNVRVIRLARNTGQTAALACGFSNSPRR